MMREIEVKILDVDRPSLEKKLIKFGAKKVFDGELRALYFDYKDQSLKKAGHTLRLRKEKDNSILTFKEYVSNDRLKQRDEYEAAVDDFDKTKDILERLGFMINLELHKHRISYSFGNVKVEFDKYLGKHLFVPEFLEIEGPDEGNIYCVARLLGYDKSDCKPWTTKELIAYYS
jgi:adenylate cyclase, class 2